MNIDDNEITNKHHYYYVVKRAPKTDEYFHICNDFAIINRINMDKDYLINTIRNM